MMLRCLNGVRVISTDPAKQYSIPGVGIPSDANRIASRLVSLSASILNSTCRCQANLMRGGTVTPSPQRFEAKNE